MAEFMEVGLFLLYALIWIGGVSLILMLIGGIIGALLE